MDWTELTLFLKKSGGVFYFPYNVNFDPRMLISNEIVADIEETPPY
jgi:hypothetical protein